MIVNDSDALPQVILYSGRHIVLRRVTPEDAFLLFGWLQTPAGVRYRDGLLDICPNPQRLAARIAMQLAIAPPLEYEVVILHAPSETPIGIVGLSAIDTRNGKAELSLALMRGRGTRCFLETVAIVLERSFAAFDLHKLIFHVRSDNKPVLRLMERYGITAEGILREELATEDGFRSDLYRFALFRRDWLVHPLHEHLLQLFPKIKEQ
ncbi:MAG: GNAT family protein [Pseudomonadota bacterium]